MSVESDLYSHLSAHSGLAALVGTRISPQKSIQAGSLPCVTYQRISGGRDYTHGETSSIDLNNPEYQVDSFARTYDSAKAVAAQVRAALEAFDAVKAFIKNEWDLYESDTEIHRVSMTVSVWTRS